MDKILRVDVGAEGGPKASVEGLGDYAGMGGRGMTSMVVSREVTLWIVPQDLRHVTTW